MKKKTTLAIFFAAATSMFLIASCDRNGSNSGSTTGMTGSGTSYNHGSTGTNNSTTASTSYDPTGSTRGSDNTSAPNESTGREGLTTGTNTGASSRTGMRTTSGYGNTSRKHHDDVDKSKDSTARSKHTTHSTTK